MELVDSIGEGVTATKGDLRRELRKRRFVGMQLSNVAWNLARGRRPKDVDKLQRIRKLCDEWDAIERADLGGEATKRRDEKRR